MIGQQNINPSTWRSCKYKIQINWWLIKCLYTKLAINVGENKLFEKWFNLVKKIPTEMYISFVNCNCCFVLFYLFFFFKKRKIVFEVYCRMYTVWHSSQISNLSFLKYWRSPNYCKLNWNIYWEFSKNKTKKFIMMIVYTTVLFSYNVM